MNLNFIKKILFYMKIKSKKQNANFNYLKKKNLFKQTIYNLISLNNINFYYLFIIIKW